MDKKNLIEFGGELGFFIKFKKSDEAVKRALTARMGIESFDEIRFAFYSAEYREWMYYNDNGELNHCKSLQGCEIEYQYDNEGELMIQSHDNAPTMYICELKNGDTVKNWVEIKKQREKQSKLDIAHVNNYLQYSTD